jgi:lactoylglutathione lyase
MGARVRAGGLLVATLSAQPNWGQVEPDWLGAPMYFSGYSVDDNKRFVEEAGFDVRMATVETIHEDGRPVAFLWVVAEKRTPDRKASGALFRKIDSVQIPVPDLEAGLAFYRDQLGHELIWRTSTSAGLRMPDTDAELVLQTERDQMETDLLVASTDEAVAAIRRAGGQVAAEAFDIPIGRCAVVRDPWGNVLVLLDSTKGSLITDSDGVVLTDASGAPRLKPRP